jgi:hypothetical protein
VSLLIAEMLAILFRPVGFIALTTLTVVTVVTILGIFLQGPPSSMKIIMVICAVLGLVGCFNNTRYSLYSMIIRLEVSVMVFTILSYGTWIYDYMCNQSFHH